MRRSCPEFLNFSKNELGILKECKNKWNLPKILLDSIDGLEFGKKRINRICQKY